MIHVHALKLVPKSPFFYSPHSRRASGVPCGNVVRGSETLVISAPVHQHFHRRSRVKFANHDQRSDLYAFWLLQSPAMSATGHPAYRAQPRPSQRVTASVAGTARECMSVIYVWGSYRRGPGKGRNRCLTPHSMRSTGH